MRAPLCLVLVGCLLGAAPALAADPADKKIKEAASLLRQGDLNEAEKLLLSLEQPGAKGLQLLGQVQVKRRRYEDALRTYERYLQVETSASKRAAVEQLVADLKNLMQTRFKITTTPEGATVYIDSKVDGPVGKTPISQIVSPGRHKLFLELEGHEPIKIVVSAVDQKELELPFTLLPLGCDLTITTDPPKARVFIDGKGAGQAPIKRRLRSGLYRIEGLLAEGEPPVLQQVTCDEKNPTPLNVALSRAGSGAPASGQGEPPATPGPGPTDSGAR